MAQLTNEVKQMNTGGARVRKRNGSALLLALSLTALIMGGAYSGLCAWAGSRTVFYPNETISGIAVGGLSVEQAAQALSGALPGQTITLSSAQAAEDYGLGYDLIAGNDIAAFRKIAEAMIAQGL